MLSVINVLPVVEGDPEPGPVVVEPVVVLPVVDTLPVLDVKPGLCPGLL